MKQHPTQDLGASSTILGRWLHFGLATCIVLCLILSLLFVLSLGTQISGALVAFNLHKFIGLNGLLPLCLYLMCTAQGQAKQWGDLFPWFSGSRLARIRQELMTPAGWLHMHAVPSMAQGLGIMFAGLAFLTGLYLVLAILMPALSYQDAVNGAKVTHRIASNTLWIYFAIHVGAVALHLVCGVGDQVRAMFKLLDPEPIRAGDFAVLSPEVPRSHFKLGTIQSSRAGDGGGLD